MKMILGLLLLLCAACSNTKNSEETMFVQIRSSKNTNRGTPLYVIVKETSMADFLIDDYHEIATQSFWKEESHQKLMKKVLVPGKTDQMEIEVSGKDKSIGLYFIFTNPGESWKYFVDNPQSKKVKVLLGDHEYEAINVYES